MNVLNQHTQAGSLNKSPSTLHSAAFHHAPESRPQGMTGRRPIRVLLADDHPVVRHGISSCLAKQQNITIIGQAIDGRDAMRKAKELQPDIHHFVAPYLKTVARYMADSVDHAGVSLHDIGSVNAHAASTKIGDQVEYEALRSVFGDRIPPVTANKSMIGHAMGASSAIESILAMEGMRKNTLLPTINYTPDPELVLDACPPSPAGSPGSSC